MNKTSRSIDTKLIHAGETPRVGGAVVLPIFQSANFEFAGKDALRYIRLNNTPNHEALRQKLAALENAEDAVVAGSGMAAISTAFLAVLSAGDHLLIQECLYGGTHDLVTKDLTALGITHDFIDPDAPKTWDRRLKPSTKAIYVETISNPLLQVGDLEAAPKFAKTHGLVSMIDNTFASPVNFRPAELGFDLSLHSATKYLNGHSDIVAGAVIGSAALVKRVKHKLDHFGGTLDPHACFLFQRGVKTLGVRVRRQNESSLAVARFLEGHRAVAKVNHPGLKSHPRHARAKKLFDGFGGMLSLEFKGGLKAAERFMAAAELPIVAPSLGGVETLMTRPATTSHRGLTPDERSRLGISDALLRVSIGLEDPADLIADFEKALKK